MAPPTGRYKIYDFYKAVLQMNVATVLTETTFLYANKLDLKPQEKTITFAGDGKETYVYLTTAITVEFSQDCVDLAALAAAFSKSKVTASIPSGLAELTWFGDLVEAAGVNAGFYGEANAQKDVAGVLSIVKIRVWFPLGILTNAKPTGLTTSAKMDTPMLRLSAQRTTVDVVGAALPSVPSGGATYAIAELS